MKGTGMEFSCIIMERGMMDTGKIIRHMAREIFYFLMAIPMMGTGSRIRRMDTESILTEKIHDMKVNGEIIFKMV